MCRIVFNKGHTYRAALIFTASFILLVDYVKTTTTTKTLWVWHLFKWFFLLHQWLWSLCVQTTLMVKIGTKWRVWRRRGRGRKQINRQTNKRRRNVKKATNTCCEISEEHVFSQGLLLSRPPRSDLTFQFGAVTRSTCWTDTIPSFIIIIMRLWHTLIIIH